MSRRIFNIGKASYLKIPWLPQIRELSLTMTSYDTAFPREDLLPKKETGAASFLSKFPQYDGRGTVIAIFDSGVDPRAPGLQVTSDGKQKIIDCFDGSGAGDVLVAPAEVKNGTITGGSGRILKIPDTWTNPSGEYRIGCKSVYQLYSRDLKERILKEYKTTKWDPGHKKALAEATRVLQAFEAAHPDPSGEDKQTKEDLEMRVEMLNTLEKKYNNVGPCLDCVVFHDGERWRACLDTTFSGNLSECKLMGIYRETYDVGTLSEADQLSYAINFYPEDDVLEIVTMCSSHGTHVASIAAACFPDEPERNGLAPGAQIVSINLGDNRLGSMETGTSLVRAMIRVMEQTHYKVDVINMSYGEHANWSHSGRLGEVMSDVVNKYGINWVVSGSNHGPALSTVGTPPDLSTTSLIGVGAYVSPEMMAAEYSLREKLTGMPYTWSSRGPCIDGSMGISICAPGAAITSVPNFTLRGSQLMNGTSMAAPHVTGVVALLLSGLKQRNIPSSPFSVKRALEQTAARLDGVEVFAQGHGLVQVERAFDHLVNFHGQQERDIHFKITVSNPGGQTLKGIYLRDVPTVKAKEYAITVEPVFLNDEERDAASKIQFNLQLSLACSASWVHIPKHLDLMYMARGFSIRVDPSGLAAGVHYTCVKAYDAACTEKGAVFEVPITVVKSESVHREIAYTRQFFGPGDIQRRFINVPNDATWATLSINLENVETEANNARFIVHAVQLMPELNCKAGGEFYKLVDLHEQPASPLSFAVKGGRVLELCMTKWWASLGTVQISYTIKFRGVSSNSGNAVAMHAGQGIMRLELCSSLANEDIAPAVTLKHQVQPVRPNEFKIVPLGCRDIIRPGRQIYELQLNYSFNVPKATEVIPNCSLLSDVLYESEFESQLWMIFDANKQFLSAGDAYPNNYTVKLEKGDYTLRLHVRHEKKDLLEKLQDMAVLIGQKLSAPIPLDVYGTQSQAVIQGKKMSSVLLHQGALVPVYICPLSSEKAGKTVSVGQFFTGTISYPKDEQGKKVDQHPFTYSLVEAPKKTNGTKPEKDGGKSPKEEMAEAIRDLKISWMTKLGEDGGTGSAELFEELRSAYPDHLPVYVARLQALEGEKEQKPEMIVELADEALKRIDVSELLEFYGMKSDSRKDAAKIKCRMDKNKAHLLDLLAKKGVALCEIYQASDKANATATLESIQSTLNDVCKFVDSSDTKVIKFAVAAAIAQNQYGKALRLVHKQLEEKSTRDMEEKMIELFAALEWPHAEECFGRALPLKYPGTFRPF